MNLRIKKHLFLTVLATILFTLFFTGNIFSEPLTADQAFQFNLKATSSKEVTASWDIAKGFHLYKSQISVALASENGTVLGKINYPEGIPEENEVYGKYQVYEGKLIINIPIEKWGTSPTEFVVNYQGCEGSLRCYPPETKVVAIDTPQDAISTGTVQATSSIPQSSTLSTPSLFSTQQLLEGGNIFLILGSFFVFGLFLSLTPCVLPMIPILVGLIMGQKEIKQRKAFLLSITYVLGMAITYSVAGMITATLGSSVQSVFQNVWVISACSIIFVLLALSLFGLYELQLPSWMLNRLNTAANKTKSGSYLGVFLMGIISSLIVSPCVSAPLAGTLIYIATTGDVLLGGLALFVLAIGMGVLLVICGTSGGKFLVKAGGWMQIVRYFLGIVMIAFAIWMLGRIIPSQWTDMMYGFLLIGVGLYMGAIEPIQQQGRFKKFIKMIAFFILVAGVGISIRFFIPTSQVSSTSSTSNKIIVPEDMKSAKIPQQVSEEGFIKVTTLQQLNKILEKAKAEKKPAVIDYYADWCTDCKEMEATTFKNIDLQYQLKSFVAIQADITKDNSETSAMKKKYGVFAPPYFIFIAPDGTQIKNATMAGLISATDFVNQLQIIKSIYGTN